MTTVVELMTGPRAAEFLQAALTGRPGEQVPGFRCTADRVHDRVGAETSVTYQVSYTTPGGPVSDFLVATTAEVDSAASVEIDTLRIRVWRHPDDPRLPGLAGASTPEVLRSWLPTRAASAPQGSTGRKPTTRIEESGADVEAGADEAAGAMSPGVEGPGVPEPGRDITDLLVYRPLRRAVLRTRSGSDTYFIKVVRPKNGELLRRRHELLTGLGPDVVATPEPGVLITAHAPGSSLAVALSAWQLGETDRRPDPREAVALLDRLPAEVVSLPARPSWTDRVDFYREMAAVRLPQHAPEIRAMGAEIAALAKRFPVGPVVPTHGDFHDGNVFCEEGRPTRMIDVDTVGPGRREDDLACMIAHLAVLPNLSPVHYPRGAEITDSWTAAFEQVVDPGALRTRVAGVLLSLVSVPDTSMALTRLDLVRSWLWRASAAG